MEVHLRKLLEERLPRSRPGAGPRFRVWTAGSPFRGLETFDFDHSPIFFGRTKATSEVLDALRAQASQGRPFVLVLGMSGCGKSSLVRAGVLPLLTQPGVIEGVGLWLVLIAILGILVCAVWWSNVSSFQQLNRAKFQVIHELEQRLPFPCYDKEWELLGQGADRRKYLQLTRIEKALPLVLTIPCLLLLLIAIVFLV